MPGPICMRPPLPVMPCVSTILSERLKATKPPGPVAKPLVLPKLPAVPPMPNCNVPPVTEVRPLYVFGPARTWSPAPSSVRPVALVPFWIAPLKVVEPPAAQG